MPSWDNCILSKMNPVNRTVSGDAESSKGFAEEVEFTPEQQRKILHKVDRRLITVSGLLVAVSLMDRANLGNAAIAGYAHIT